MCSEYAWRAVTSPIWKVSISSVSHYMTLAYQAWREQRSGEAARLCAAAADNDPNDDAALNLLGVLAAQRGERMAAIEHFAKALELCPARDDYRMNLCRALIAADRFAEAENALQEGLERDAQNAQYWRLLAYVYVKQEELEKARSCYDKVLRLEPSVAGNYFGKSEIHRLKGEYSEAIECLEKALKLDPNNTTVLNNLTGVQLANGNFTAAMLSVKRLLELDPRSAQAYCNLGSLLSVAGDEQQAIIALRNALVLEPGLYRAKYLLASLLINAGELEESESILRSLLESHSDSAPCKVALVRILERKGELDEAEALLATVDPKLQDLPDVAIVRSVILEQRGHDEQAIDELEKAIENYPVVAVEGIGIQFLLGRLYDKQGRYDEAFRAVEQGNLNRKKAQVELDSDDGTGETLSEKMLRLFSPELYERCPESGLETQVPVFIVGMPRSGTTLVEQVLASHPQVCGGGELIYLQELIADTYKTGEPSSPFQILPANRFSGEQFSVPRGWGNNSVDDIASLANGYLEKLRALGPDAERITDKLPYHFSLVPLIHRLFPRAHIIHCVRHPLDTCLSCYFQNFTTGNQFSFDLASLGEYYAEYRKIMQAWKNDLEIPILDMHYEVLVESPEDSVRRLLDFVGLDWNDACLKFHRSKRVVHTASYQQVRKPLYATSVGRWKDYSDHLQPLIATLGEFAQPN